MEKGGPAGGVPWNLLTYFDLNRTAWRTASSGMFGGEVSEWTRERLLAFSRGEEGLRYRLVEGLRVRARELKNWRNRVQPLNTRIRGVQDERRCAKRTGEERARRAAPGEVGDPGAGA